jgi:hypothetical protein
MMAAEGGIGIVVVAAGAGIIVVTAAGSEIVMVIAGVVKIAGSQESGL